jgi:hypothetical protein
VKQVELVRQVKIDEVLQEIQVQMAQPVHQVHPVDKVKWAIKVKML